MRIGVDRTVRSLFFGANLTGANTTVISVDDVANNGTTARVLTFEADNGNASLTVASGYQSNEVRIGASNGGGIGLSSSLNLSINQNVPVTFFREVGGTGAINVNGVGIVDLLRNNTFQGGININSGSALVRNNNAAAGTGSIALGAVNGSADATLAAAGGSSAARTFANNITVNAGDGDRTIRNDISGLVPTLSGNITLDKTVNFDVADLGVNQDVLISSGEISGTGGIVKSGSGGLLLNGVNTFTGPTTVNGDGAGFVRISADAGLGAAPASATASHLVLNDGGLNTAASFTLSANRGIELAGAGGQIFTNTSTLLAYDGIMAGTNFEKDGTGVLTLGGDNTYTGVTQVLAGGLIVNGNQSAATGAVTVDVGATLGGTGTLGGATTVSGVLSPGDGGIGTLTVADSVTWNGTGSWLFELGTAGLSLGSPGTSDLLAITGDFLKGAGPSWTFDFAGMGNQGWYKLVDWTGGTTDFVFGDFTATNLGGGNAGTFVIQGDALYIEVVPEPSTFALLGGVAAVGVFMMRRRRTIG
jgi:fibronectin-binding autotransporter adhesin